MEEILPRTRGCFVCGEDNPRGLQLRSRRSGEKVVLEYCPRPEEQGWGDILHGGIAMAVQDEVMTWAAILHSRSACVSAELSTRMRHPIPIGQPVRVEGWVEPGSRPRLIRTAARILDAEGQELATARGKYMPRPASALPLPPGTVLE
jgi:acyl-coenzyme A thioesterase PaaI-like protein